MHLCVFQTFLVVGSYGLSYFAQLRYTFRTSSVVSVLQAANYV